MSAQVAALIAVTVNILVMLGFALRFGNWTGRVTTLLEEHQKDHKAHYTTTTELAGRVSRVEGHLDL